MNTAKDTSKIYLDIGKAKAQKSASELLVLGVLAGIFIAFACAMTNMAMHAVENPGLARTICGCLFPIGLVLVVFAGAELFTGNALMSIALYEGVISPGKMFRNWGIVYTCNLIGALLVAVMIVYSNQLNLNNAKLAAFTIKVATNKANLSFHAALISGILCNILVCMAVFMAAQATSAPGKIMAAYLPILYFITGGFEHVVANMYYIPAGLIAMANPAYAQAAVDMGVKTETLTLGNAILHNYLPVTIGNIIGGLFIGTAFWFVYVRAKKAALKLPETQAEHSQANDAKA